MKSVGKWFISMKLIITVQGDTKSFVFDVGKSDEFTIGRFDPSTNLSPSIDLDPHHAKEQGVSRRHAAIGWHQNFLHIVDLGSYNGTCLNGLRLFPFQPRRLRDGDEIQIGQLILCVELEFQYQTAQIS
jgi:pSer/pThr/pTyr-binding forkhead associated (FHA) protein